MVENFRVQKAQQQHVRVDAQSVVIANLGTGETRNERIGAIYREGVINASGATAKRLVATSARQDNRGRREQLRKKCVEKVVVLMSDNPSASCGEIFRGQRIADRFDPAATTRNSD